MTISAEAARLALAFALATPMTGRSESPAGSF